MKYITIWLLTLALLAGALWLSIRPGWINGDLLALLPQPNRDAEVVAALKHVQQSTVNQVLVLTQAKTAREAAKAAKAYAGTLRGSGFFEQLDAKSPVTPSAVAKLYQPYRFQILSPAQRKHLRQTPVQALAGEAVRRAYSAPGEISGREIASDPLGLFRGALQGLFPEAGWSLQDGTPVRHTPSGYVGVVHGVLSVSPFALKLQPALSAALTRAAHSVRQATPGVHVLTAGAIWHAVAQVRQARWELSIIGFGSIAAVVLLIIGVFGSLRPLLIGVLSLATGCLAALSVTELIFGQVFLFTLVFGASLIGVAIDYSLHVFADRFGRSGVWSARTAAAHLRTGLALALGTTVLGYAALALTPLPGLRQMACFSVVGLIAAWISVMLFAPQWGGAGRGRRAPRLAEWTDASVQRLYRHGAVLALVMLAVCIPGWLWTHFSDNVAALRMPLPQLSAMEHKVRTLLGAADESQFFLVSAPDGQTLLRREARLGQRLDDLVRRGALHRWRGLVRFVPPPAQQQRNYRLLAAKVFGPQGAAPRAWRRLGFSDAYIAQQEATFRAAASRRLTLDTWLQSPASQALRYLWLGKLPDGNLATVVVLGGVGDTNALDKLALPGVQLIDPVSALTAVMATQRRHIEVFLLVAYLLVGLLLMCVYGPGGGLRALFPPVAASALAVAALGWAGEPLDLFALFALLLVLGIGVDYSIFVREAGNGERRIGAWSAVCMSALTTALAFGLMTVSRTPAIHRFGLTLLVGIAAAWILAPLAQRQTENDDA